MIEQTLPLQFVKKSPYTGSHKGMRFRLWKDDDGLALCIYPEPFAFEHTPEENKKNYHYEFTEEGYEKAYEEINREFDEHYRK